jgi:hypothetical protein
MRQKRGLETKEKREEKRREEKSLRFFSSIKAILPCVSMDMSEFISEVLGVPVVWRRRNFRCVEITADRAS